MCRLADYRRADIDRKVHSMGAYPLDVMLIGVTGTSKSTTINSIFQRRVARVGESYNPETMSISDHRLNEVLRLWDTPGLGDGIENDKQHSRNIIDKLYETFSMNGTRYGLIDLVLVIVDGSNRDMGTTYNLLTGVLAPNIDSNRILAAINQADLAMSGKHWDNFYNAPDYTLSAFLNDKADSIQRRVREAAGITIIRPVCYSAEKWWNIPKLLDLIIDNIPANLRRI
ncbi:MAG: 50S ribosome-binding GTPase [Synergistaceae bacterium]|nr:50S ribosome-binding GTPase [Synergistaceae bacterium]